ncbi:MAG: hypothetical protein MK188_06375 [Gammaproteobacteria bacterium]|nr:hypothetical protein [Gammaproteobacteria bacterium]
MAKNDTSNRRRLLLGLGTGGAALVWKKPILDAVVLPAHAQMSVCAMITLGNVVTGPVSGSPVPPVCQVTFDVLSGTAGMSLDIVSVTTSALPANVSVTIDPPGPATDSTGPRVVWRGPALEAPFCVPVTPQEEIIFTVTATCAAAISGTFSQDFTLSSLL